MADWGAEPPRVGPAKVMQPADLQMQKQTQPGSYQLQVTHRLLVVYALKYVVSITQQSPAAHVSPSVFSLDGDSSQVKIPAGKRRPTSQPPLRGQHRLETVRVVPWGLGHFPGMCTELSSSRGPRKP